MRKLTKTFLLAGTMAFWSIPSASALIWECPEIDASAGLSAIAILMSVAVLSYERFKGE